MAALTVTNSSIGEEESGMVFLILTEKKSSGYSCANRGCCWLESLRCRCDGMTHFHALCCIAMILQAHWESRNHGLAFPPRPWSMANHRVCVVCFEQFAVSVAQTIISSNLPKYPKEAQPFYGFLQALFPHQTEGSSLTVPASIQ